MACLFQNDMAVDEINREPLFGVMLLPVAVPFPRLELTARHADELGYDTLWLFDHLDTPHAEPGAATLDLYEGWTAATWLAARTERIRIGHNVLCASLRHPTLLAKIGAAAKTLFESLRAVIQAAHQGGGCERSDHR